MIAIAMDNATREVFGNIAPWMQVVFFVMIAASIGVLVWQFVAHLRLWRKGQPGGFERDWRVWVRRLLEYGLAQKRVHKKSLGALLHLLLFSGFLVLTIGTTLLGIAHDGPYNFHHGWYYLIYELTLDIFGVAFCLGCVLAMYRRAFQRPASLGHNPRDWWLLGVLLSLGLTGFLVEALRMHYTQVQPEIAHWSVVGWLVDVTMLRGLGVDSARSMHLAAWWLHAILVAAFFATIPVNRFLHVITGPLNIALRPERPMGALVPLQMEEVEQTGLIGVSEIEQFTRQQLLSLDSCMECGRCEDACPATATGKPLSPKKVVTDLRWLMGHGGELHRETIQAETLWACTMCQGVRPGVPRVDRACRLDQRHAPAFSRRGQSLRAACASAATDWQPIQPLRSPQLRPLGLGERTRRADGRNESRLRLSVLGRLRRVVRSARAEGRACDGSAAQGRRGEFRGARSGGELHRRSRSSNRR